MDGAVQLVTDDDATDDIVRDAFEQLPTDSRFHSRKIVRRSSITAALSALAAPGAVTPVLIILDGAVRQSGMEPVQTDGGPAASLLERLRDDYASVPVVVVSQGSLEKVESEVLQRWDVALWKPPPPSSLQELAAAQIQFATILKGLGDPDVHRKREITITVGPRSANYHVADGHYTFEFGRPYKIEDQPARLIRQLKRFAPYKNGQLRPDWQDYLAETGQDLYRLIVEDVFGRQLLEKIKLAGHGVDFRFHVELGEITGHGEVDDLFLLPFEAANADLKPENFFCARVPMARRVKRQSARRRPPRAAGRILRILLVVGAEGGVSSVPNETGGVADQVQLDLLGQVGEVRQEIARYCTDADGVAVAVLDVLDAAEAKGRAFQQALKSRLTSNDYDVVHFYGHSVAGPGGTFLIAPGEIDFTGHPISIRAIASWIGDLTDPGRHGRLPVLVLLSSCQSGSVLTAVEMMEAGVENVIGFRWEVEESTAADYVAAFYKAYLGRREPVTEAYRYACDQARVLSQGTPGWASAIALTNDGWEAA